MNDSSQTIAPIPAKSLVNEQPLPTQTISSPVLPVASEKVDDLICFSHLRWNFACQRPQHLLSRAARRWRVWYIEEPVWGDPETPNLSFERISHQLTVVVPRLPHGTGPGEAVELQRSLIDQLLAEQNIRQYALWYYTPMALPFSDYLRPQLTVYDCMDELSAFLGAPRHLIEQERQLMSRADVVFTGGYSLYEAKQKRHPQVYAFPSCIAAMTILSGLVIRSRPTRASVLMRWLTRPIRKLLPGHVLGIVVLSTSGLILP